MIYLYNLVKRNKCIGLDEKKRKERIGRGMLCIKSQIVQQFHLKPRINDKHPTKKRNVCQS